jgi:hypothetical protein
MCRLEVWPAEGSRSAIGGVWTRPRLGACFRVAVLSYVPRAMSCDGAMYACLGARHACMRLRLQPSAPLGRPGPIRVSTPVP